jgi:hypothetical protein
MDKEPVCFHARVFRQAVTKHFGLIAVCGLFRHVLSGGEFDSLFIE